MYSTQKDRSYKHKLMIAPKNRNMASDTSYSWPQKTRKFIRIVDDSFKRRFQMKKLFINFFQSKKLFINIIILTYIYVNYILFLYKQNHCLKSVLQSEMDSNGSWLVCIRSKVNSDGSISIRASL